MRLDHYMVNMGRGTDFTPLGSYLWMDSVAGSSMVNYCFSCFLNPVSQQKVSFNINDYYS